MSTNATNFGMLLYSTMKKVSSGFLIALLICLGISFDSSVAFRSAARLSQFPCLSIRNKIDDYRCFTNHRLDAVAEASEVLPAIITISFAAISVYTFKNPDTSDNIREAWDELVDTSKTAKTINTISPTTTTSSELRSTISSQEELVRLMKNVSETVDNRSAKLDELRLRSSDNAAVPSSDEVPKPKGRFVVRLAKKIIAPWRPWNEI